MCNKGALVAGILLVVVMVLFGLLLNDCEQQLKQELQRQRDIVSQCEKSMLHSQFRYSLSQASLICEKPKSIQDICLKQNCMKGSKHVR